MLAYELNVVNRDNENTIAKKETPIQKIIYSDDDITIPKDHGAEKSTDPTIQFLQTWLSMPLNTISYDEMRLADIDVRPNQNSPYIRIFCILEKKKKQKLITHEIMMKVGSSKSDILAVYDIENDKLKFKEGLDDIPIRINKEDYFTSDGESLFDQYKTCNILNKNLNLSFKVFKKIIEKFIENLKNYTRPDMTHMKKKQIPFLLYVLPTDKKILKKQEQESGHTFIDAFGNNATHFSDDTTLTAKFLSSNEKAFTINCKERKDFYENLGIGDISLKNIEFPTNNIMNIAGLQWLFIDMRSPGNTFEQTSGGILTQLHKNYQKLKIDNNATQKLAMMKIMCMISDNSKIEILLDENLTLLKQQSLLGDINTPPQRAFEIMIPKRTSSKSKTIWSDYLYIVNSFISGTKVKKGYFIAFFTKQIKAQLLNMLTGKTSASDFFKRSEFLINFLSYKDKGQDQHMTTAEQELVGDEKYAFNIGSIAKHYIDFKRKRHEENNSLLGILKYSKYDKTSLQNVLAKVGAGIALSKTNTNSQENSNDQKSDVEELEEDIKILVPRNEIKDENHDYSYFFYKGYFSGGSKL